MQRSNDNLRYKLSSYDSYMEEIKYLKQKISEYESKVSSLAYKPSIRRPNT